MRYVYINGQYCRPDAAYVSINDRGYQFGDGIYEAVCLKQGRLIDLDAHLARLQESLAILKIKEPCTLRALKGVIAELYRRERVTQGMLYIQVTRGIAPRNHAFPVNGCEPSLLVYIRPATVMVPRKTCTAFTTPETRSAFAYLKTTAILPNIMARQEAVAKGGQEAIFTKDGFVKEGASSNVFLVKNDVLYTPAADGSIVPGVARQCVIDMAIQRGMRVQEQDVPVQDFFVASEVFMSLSSNGITGITKIDGKKIGNGAIGQVALDLFQDYLDHAMGKGLKSV